MKRVATLLAATVLSLPMAALAAQETYTLDPSHTAVVWSINHFGFSNPSGKFANITGTLVLDDVKPENSSVNATISIGELYTGVAKLDEHLKTPDFFDAAQFPTATFVSKRVEVTGKDTANVVGTLTVHGVSKDVVLTTKLNKIGPNMMNKKTAGFSATLDLKRSDFGISKYVPNLGDDVKISIETEANLQ